jgi:hypothetical protein
MRLEGGKVGDEVCAVRCCHRDLEEIGIGKGSEAQSKA